MYQVINNDEYYVYDIYEEQSYYIGDKYDFLRYACRKFFEYDLYSEGYSKFNPESVAMNFNDKYRCYDTDGEYKLFNRRYIFFINDCRIINIKDYEEEIMSYKPVYKRSKHKYKKHKYGHCSSRYNDKMRYKRAMAYQIPLEEEYKIKHRKYFGGCIWDYIERHKRVQGSWKKQSKHKCQFKGDRKTIRRMEELICG